MRNTLFILNDAPYGTERGYNGLRLAGSLAKREGEQVRVFLIGAATTLLPMTVRPGDAATDAELELQIMLTSGKSAKGAPDTWLRSNYLLRTLVLRVTDP